MKNDGNAQTKTHIVNGVKIPDLRVRPKYGEQYYLVRPTSKTFVDSYRFGGFNNEILWVERGLTYPDTEEGMEAAILHSKSMLGIA